MKISVSSLSENILLNKDLGHFSSYGFCWAVKVSKLQWYPKTFLCTSILKQWLEEFCLCMQQHIYTYIIHMQIEFSMLWQIWKRLQILGSILEGNCGTIINDDKKWTFKKAIKLSNRRSKKNKLQLYIQKYLSFILNNHGDQEHPLYQYCQYLNWRN